MSGFKLTIDQAVNNMKVLHHTGVIFTTDANGNINHISKFNIFGRFFNYIKNLIEGTGEHKVNQAILATFQQISADAIKNSHQPIWTYSIERKGCDFDIGFDKVAMRVLLDESRFRNSYYHSPDNKLDRTKIKIREAAYQVLLMATDQRSKRVMSFDSDQLL